MNEAIKTTSEPHVVFFKYQMKTPKGKVLDTSGSDVFAFIETKEQVFPKVELALKDLDKGGIASVALTPSDAFGEYKDDLIYEVNKTELSGEVELDQLVGYENANGDVMELRVVDFKDDFVILDANHPFAGMNVHFDVEIMDKRRALPEELAEGKIVKQFDGSPVGRELNA